MLKPIKCDGYDDETYESIKDYYYHEFNSYKELVPLKDGEAITRSVVSVIFWLFTDELDLCGMDSVVLLLSGMLWAIQNGGIPDNDPDELAYNAWFVLNEFKTGKYDNLFTPEDLVLIKKDLKMVFAYYDEHPTLKG